MSLTRKRAVRQLRTTQRFPTDIPALLHVGLQRYAVRVADISADGAKLRCPVAVPLGVPVTVEIGTQVIASQVIWRREGSCGPRFTSAVSPLEIVRKNLPGFRVLFGTSVQSRDQVIASDQLPVDSPAIVRNCA